MKELIIKLLNLLIGKITYEDNKLITAGTGYKSDKGFFILVLSAGSVVYTTMKGNVPTTVTLSAGWLPIKIKEIHTTTAVDVLIAW